MKHHQTDELSRLFARTLRHYAHDLASRVNAGVMFGQDEIPFALRDVAELVFSMEQVCDHLEAERAA